MASANRRHIMFDTARIGTGSMAVNLVGFKYLVSKYNTVIAGVESEVVETPGLVATAGFFLEMARTGLVRNSDRIAIISGTEEAPVIDETKKVKLTFVNGVITAATLVAR